MAKKITQTQIDQMIRLYAEIGTYSGVATAMGISASTVSRYIKEHNNIKTYANATVPTLKPVEQIHFNDLTTFSYPTPEEIHSYCEWLREFNR